MLFIFSTARVQVIRMVGESADSVTATVGSGSSGNKMPTLEEYGTNLTKLAEEVRKGHSFLHEDGRLCFIVHKSLISCLLPRESWILLWEGSRKLNA